ncbi:uncharacterized protein LOC6529038 [Drosophila yakuba]|uniref:MD-2-related lipid-recognition domain-containing protein n=1 Tax=Drosophila yakuba TaxID=7245 RepID=B4NYT0_DROYA|nr:uncharacterized protein LOC6529038 [Drosophila yakuba]EDW89781.2 uncharacterized protein Dyak_GE20825 [Drosophila yakuba]
MKYLLWICFLFIGKSHGYVRLTNLACESYDKTFVDFPECRLKVLGRGIIGANIHVKFLKLPINRMAVRFTVYRKLSGYHPFLFNVSEEFCRVLKHPNRLRVFYYFYTAFLPFSNLNHTCPYNADVFIRNCTLSDRMFAKVPLPKGIYKLTLEMDDGVVNWVSIINVYFEINVD